MRRTLALMGLSVLIATTAAADDFGVPSTVERWSFDVMLDKRNIGVHRFELIKGGGAIELRSDARFDVKILFINAFRYRHQSTEQWRDGCLVSVEAATDSNGDSLSVVGTTSAEGFVVDGKAGEETLDSGCIMSFAYWNPAIIEQSALLNTQTGVYQAVDIRRVGEENVQAAGGSYPAVRYDIDTGKGVIKLWYGAESNRWLALEAPAKGDRTIRYRLRGDITLADSRSGVRTGAIRNDI
ncbi:MAG: DUF6134 family protein [Pseudomonadota bacterium]